MDYGRTWSPTLKSMTHDNDDDDDDDESNEYCFLIDLRLIFPILNTIKRKKV